MLGKITIIGRPNVGKSSFFNMYTGHKIAIVSDISGTTRDIVEFEYNDRENDITYILADSGGLDFNAQDDEVADDIIERTDRAIDESDILIWLIEYDRLTILDEKILELLRKKNYQNVIVVANKADDENKQMEAYSLAGTGGFEDFVPVSVSHNRGVGEVRNLVAKKLKEKGLNYKYEEVDDEYVKLAIVGRPNVGKSSLINAITGENKVMVKDLWGTTRDSVDTKFENEAGKFVLIDTAGIRRPGKIGKGNIEDWSVMRSERAITRADVVAVVVDGKEGIAHQDLAVINRVLEENKGLILVVNKWDLVLAKPGIDKTTMMNRYIEYLKAKIEFLSWAPVVFSSALEGKRVEEILKNAASIKEERNKRVKTGVLNNFMEQVIYKHPPTGNKKSHNPKIYFASQPETNPPRFVLSVNNEKHFHFSYKRYLENRIRDNFGFFGTPIIIDYKQKEGTGRYRRGRQKNR
ncbi:MAG: ribosome biogenesis GTPase Der [Candidatus Gracilibacteria bacterium]|nr:ribosome biogenesis GTPase Der [Candidatus Gracilibacteria bacterium]